MLLRILAILIVLLIGPGIYIVWRFKNLFKTPLQRILILLPNLILLGCALYLSIFQTYPPLNSKMTGIFLISFLTLTTSELFFVLFCLVGRILRRIPHLEKKFIGIGGAVGITLLGIVLYGHFWGMNKIKVTRTNLVCKDLPKGFDGYRMVVFSDLHLGTFGNNISVPRLFVDSILAQKPQMIAFVGDLVNYHTDETLPFLGELRRVQAPDGVFAVMGNHDYQIHRKWNNSLAQDNSVHKLEGIMRSVGWKVLLNESAPLVHNGGSIAIVGVENDGTDPFPELGDLPKAMKGLPDSMKGKPLFKILLSHDPSHWRRKVLPQTNIQLTLSGHTHATQFQIGRFSPATWIYPEWGGLYEQGTRKLFVSKGLGEALLPFRFGAWPEINVITLYSAKQ